MGGLTCQVPFGAEIMGINTYSDFATISYWVGRCANFLSLASRSQLRALFGDSDHARLLPFTTEKRLMASKTSLLRADAYARGC